MSEVFRNSSTVRSMLSADYLKQILCEKYSFQDVEHCRALKLGGSNDIYEFSCNDDKYVVKVFFKRECWEYTEDHYIFELEILLCSYH